MNILPKTLQSSESVAEKGETIKDKIGENLKAGKQSATSCCTSIRDGSCQVCETVSDGIRTNPIGSVIGAAFVGAAVCYLILEARSQPTFRERYLSDASDCVNESLRSVGNSLKFW